MGDFEWNGTIYDGTHEPLVFQERCNESDQRVATLMWSWQHPTGKQMRSRLLSVVKSRSSVAVTTPFCIYYN